MPSFSRFAHGLNFHFQSLLYISETHHGDHIWAFSFFIQSRLTGLIWSFFLLLAFRAHHNESFPPCSIAYIFYLYSSSSQVFQCIHASSWSSISFLWRLHLHHISSHVSLLSFLHVSKTFQPCFLPFLWIAFMWAHPLINSFLILCILVDPMKNLNIFIPVAFSSASCFFVSSTVFRQYTMAGLTTDL